MKIIKRRLSELKRPKRNVRNHTDKQIKEFVRSIKMFGQIRPIVIDEENVILAGNGLYEALLSMGMTEADCYIAEGLTEAGKKKLMLADNRIFNLGVDDIDAFDSIIAELKDDFDIPGYDDSFLQSLVMDNAETADVLAEYGTVDEEDAASIRAANMPYEQPKAYEPQAPSYGITSQPISHDAPDANVGITGREEAPKGRDYVICPKCGEKIWL